MASNPSVLVVIPARGGSKGLPRKNLQELMGRSLVSRAILTALSLTEEKHVVVTTDSQEIADEARKFGALIPFLRESTLAGDFATTEETLQDCILRCEDIYRCKYDFAVYFSPSEGFLARDTVETGIKFLKDNSNYESYFSGRFTVKNYWTESENSEFTRILESMREYTSRQIKKPIWREDTGRGLVSQASLWRKGRRIGERNFIEKTQDPRADLDIHSALDLRVAEIVLRELGDHQFLSTN